MGRVAVRTCDQCSEWDHPDARVLKVTVVGPRFDLCVAHRVAALMSLGVEEEAALDFVRAQDERANAKQGVGVDDDAEDGDAE